MRLAVISPFLDRRHGTERCIVEQLERFAKYPQTEIHLYSQRVEDVANVVRYPARATGSILWHRVPRLPGPHLLGYAWWLLANHMLRWWDENVRGLKFDLLYSPGINAFDADAISIHVIFTEFYGRVSHRLVRSRNLVNLHRKLYYKLICLLEKIIYRQRNALTTISAHSSACLQKFFGRSDVPVIRYGVDIEVFSPAIRTKRRDAERASLDIQSTDFCLLMIGNDWKNKGLDTLLDALGSCREIAFKLVVVGHDDQRTYEQQIRRLRLASHIRFPGSSPDVMRFYAAADAYVAPSLEDAYGLPILEAMACGLPVIASSRAGASEIILDGQNGLILRDPEDSRELAALLRKIYSDPSLRTKIAGEATRTASQHTWDRNADATCEFLTAALARKKQTQTK